MIIVILLVAGLCMGSFVNALVWRLHEQEKELAKTKPDNKYLKLVSIGSGRSICTNCKHPLKAKDLVPLLSWIWLKGKCRYCKKPISAQYPIVEISTAFLFIASFILWPETLIGSQVAIFILWLVLFTGFMALIVYDFRWMLLPNRIIYPLSIVGGVVALIEILTSADPLIAFVNVLLAVALGGGLFYVLFQISKGKWIGGGDVKLGWLLGLVAGTPARSLLFIFIASLLGSLLSIPLLASKKLNSKSVIPFGPLLIVGLIIVQLYGDKILSWYQQTFINI